MLRRGKRKARTRFQCVEVGSSSWSVFIHGYQADSRAILALVPAEPAILDSGPNMASSSELAKADSRPRAFGFEPARLDSRPPDPFSPFEPAMECPCSKLVYPTAPTASVTAVNTANS